MYIYICIYLHICIYIYIYIYFFGLTTNQITSIGRPKIGNVTWTGSCGSCEGAKVEMGVSESGGWPQKIKLNVI